MLADALKVLTGLAQQADAVKVIKQAADGRSELIQEGGQAVDRPIPPPLREHRFGDLESLMEFAADWRGEETDAGTRQAIWYDRQGVVLIPNVEDRREELTFDLARSTQLEALIKLDQSGPLTQPQLIRLLRMDLGAPAELIAPFRRLNWRSGASGEGTIQHAKQSLGRQIEAELAGVGDLPETISVTIPLYRNPGEKCVYCVLLLIDVDASQQTFLLRTAPGEIDRALEQHEDALRQRLDCNEAGVKVFRGRPYPAAGDRPARHRTAAAQIERALAEEGE